MPTNTAVTAFTANTTSLAVARAQNTLGVGFSGSGFLILWLTGVSAVLQKLGIINSKTKLAGASGGAVTATAICAGVPSASEYAAVLNLLRTCRLTSCRGTLDATLRVALAITAPLGAAQGCKDRLYVAVTQARLNSLNPSTDLGRLIGPDWTPVIGDVDVLNAVAASSYLSLLSGPTATTFAPGIAAAVDGYYTSAIPTPPGVTYAITVSATAPGVVATLPTSFPGTVQQAITPGYLPLNPVRVASTSKPDIYPGLSGPLKFNQTTWLSFVLNAPQDDATLFYIYNTGAADAAAFVRNNGLANATAIAAALAATNFTGTTRAASALSASAGVAAATTAAAADAAVPTAAAAPDAEGAALEAAAAAATAATALEAEGGGATAGGVPPAAVGAAAPVRLTRMSAITGGVPVATAAAAAAAAAQPDAAGEAAQAVPAVALGGVVGAVDG